MEQIPNHPLLLQWGANWIRKEWKDSRLPFLSAIVFGFLAYTFAFTNKLVNHDEVYSLFIKGGTVTSGRWGLGLLDTVFPNISMPWIYGVLSVVFIAAAVCVIVRMFGLKSKLLQVLLSGSIMVFPSLIGTFGYMFTSCSFALSFLLAVIAIWFLQWNPKWGLIPALGCMVFSLSIYQSYIAVAASLLVILLIQRLLQGDDLPGIIRTGVFYVVFLAVSLGAYYAATQFFLKILGEEMNSYASGNVSFRLADIPKNILAAYEDFSAYFTDGTHALMPTALSRFLHKLCLGASGILLILWAFLQKKRELSRYLLLAALIGILPLAVNCMYLFATKDAIHTLVLYGFACLYVLVAVIADMALSCLPSRPWQHWLRQIMLEVLTLALAVVVVINIYTANAAYLQLHLRYENAYSFYTSLVADIKMLPEFDEETKLAVLGTYPDPEYYEAHFQSITKLTGVKGFLPDSYSRVRFLEYYLDFPMPAASEEELEAILNSRDYANMPVYPYYGSMKLFGDVLVVKLS